MYFVRGGILFIPTAASENAINASWMIIIGVQNDGLGVPCSTCSIWNIGFSTTGTCFGVLLAFSNTINRWIQNIHPIQAVPHTCPTTEGNPNVQGCEYHSNTVNCYNA